MAALVEKLSVIAGPGKLAEREWRIRCRLNWHTKPKSAVRHLLYGERQPSLEEAKQIEAAHIKHCAQKIEANRDENRRLYDAMREALSAMEATDPDFYRPHIEAVGEMLLRGRNAAGQAGTED
ncbi:hypothetical protein [Aestuariivirga sp.]|uniref:hypothetical protein n=1 Tax=Aestuariivirga sp. TaxID=2650926 RepID=UPI0039E65092